MPNAKVLSEKQAAVAALTEKIQNSGAGVIVDYKGITVAEDTALRAECRLELPHAGVCGVSFADDVDLVVFHAEGETFESIVSAGGGYEADEDDW